MSNLYGRGHERNVLTNLGEQVLEEAIDNVYHANSGLDVVIGHLNEAAEQLKALGMEEHEQVSDLARELYQVSLRVNKLDHEL
jgi:hypothetical protein